MPLNFLKPYAPLLLSLAAGSILPLAFAPFNVALMALIAPALLLALLHQQSIKSALLRSYLFGLGGFGVGASWIYVSIATYGNAPILLAVLHTSVFVATLALFPAVVGGLLNYFFPQPNLSRALLAFPALWVLLEISRGWILSGFPWLYLGYSQLQSALSSFAPVLGIWGVSLVCAILSGIFYQVGHLLLTQQGTRKKYTALMMMVLGLYGSAYLLAQPHWTTPSTQPLKVTLVQGNISQHLKWEPQHIQHIIDTYYRLTLPYFGHAELIIWPEAAIPLPLPYSAPFFSQLQQQLHNTPTTLITGVPVQVPEKNQYYNALISINGATARHATQDLALGHYYKQHLVPFGEYVPLESWLRGLIDFFDLPMSSFIGQAPHLNPALQSHSLTIASAICYEIAYPLLVRSRLAESADILLTVSNDTWFGHSIGPAQHLQIAQFRALETGRYVIRATNTGLTAVIDPKGQLQALAPSFREYVLNSTVKGMQGTTPWQSFGIWPVLALLCLALLMAYLTKETQQ